MFVLFFLASLFFLIWGYFLATATHLLPRLTESQLLDNLENTKNRFYYLPLHRKLFGKSSFDLLIMAASMGANIARIGFALLAFAGFMNISSFAWGWQLLAILGLYLLLFLITELSARVTALAASYRFFSFFMGTISFFLLCSLPFNYFILKILQRKKRKIESQNGENRIEKIKETILEILQSADITTPLTSNDKKLIEAVLKFKERIARQVMVPRTDLFALPTTTTLKSAAEQLIEEGYSRTPVYRDNIDNIIGVLMFKDLFEIYSDCMDGKKNSSILDQPIGSFIKGAIYAPETKKVSQLLQEFKVKQMHMAIVVDEYGGTEGVITIEDILEEIVGDISDEYDLDQEALYTELPQGNVWIVDARMTIFDAESAFSIHIPQEGDYDTIGGYIFHKLGTLPKPKDRVECEDFDLEILSVTERNVEKVRLTPRKKKEV